MTYPLRRGRTPASFLLALLLALLSPAAPAAASHEPAHGESSGALPIPGSEVGGAVLFQVPNAVEGDFLQCLWRTDGTVAGTFGFFWFFNPANVELVVKVLDGTPVNGKVWFFYGALSDVGYEIDVLDTADGHQGRRYVNPPGEICGRADTAAF